jgi:hypothetical protein
MTDWSNSIHLPLYADTTRVTAPEPLGAVLREGLSYGYAVHETAAMDATSPIFRELVNEAVAKQIAHEEAQIKAWLAAVIAHPAGRTLIEEML